MKSNSFAGIWLISVFLATALVFMVDSGAGADDEFSLNITANGMDFLETQTIVLDPDDNIILDIRIFNVTRELILKNLSMTVTFADQPILTRSISLGDYRMTAGDVYDEKISIDMSDIPEIGDSPLVTGIYRTQFKVEYTVAGQARALVQWKNLKLTGNPFGTPAGFAGMAIGLGTLTALFFMFRPAAGVTLPPQTSVEILPHLSGFASERLEPTARGRVTGSIVDAAKRRIVKERCPICETRLKHGYCFTCKKSAREVRDEYTEKFKSLCLQAGQLLAGGQVTTADELCSKLNIDSKSGADVIAALQNARLVKVKGVARRLTGKAVTVGIGTGLSTIIWITIGGFAVLNTLTLVCILAVSIIIPLVVVKSLQIKTKRLIRRDADVAVKN